MSDMRKDFEAAFSTGHNEIDNSNFCRARDGNYVKDRIQAIWEGWQAAWNRRPHPVPRNATSDLPQRLLDLLTKHGGWQATLDYIAELESRPDPAPVGVRVPDAKPAAHDSDTWAGGWNDCRAETLRLNPQPGAELSIHNDISSKLTVGQPGAVVGITDTQRMDWLCARDCGIHSMGYGDYYEYSYANPDPKNGRRGLRQVVDEAVAKFEISLTNTDKGAGE